MHCKQSPVVRSGKFWNEICYSFHKESLPLSKHLKTGRWCPRNEQPIPPDWKMIFLLYWLDMDSFPLGGYPIHSWHMLMRALLATSGWVRTDRVGGISSRFSFAAADCGRSYVILCDESLFFKGFLYITPFGWLRHEMKWYTDIQYSLPSLLFCFYNGLGTLYFLCIVASLRHLLGTWYFASGSEVMENFQAQTALKSLVDSWVG